MIYISSRLNDYDDMEPISMSQFFFQFECFNEKTENGLKLADSFYFILLFFFRTISNMQFRSGSICFR